MSEPERKRWNIRQAPPWEMTLECPVCRRLFYFNREADVHEHPGVSFRLEHPEDFPDGMTRRELVQQIGEERVVLIAARIPSAVAREARA